MVLSILAPSLALMGLLYSLNDLFMTQDRSGELRTVGLVEMVFRIVSVCIGVMFGLVGIALAYSISSAIVCLIRVNIAGRKGPVTAKDQIAQLLPALPIGLVCTISCLLMKTWLWQFPRPAVVELAFLIGAAFLGGVLAMVFGPSRRAIIELFQTFGMPAGIRGKIRRRSRSASSHEETI